MPISIKTISSEQPKEARHKYLNNVIVKKHLSRTIRAQRPLPTLVVHFYALLCYVSALFCKLYGMIHCCKERLKM